MGETIIRMLTLLFTFRTDTTSERNAEESVANFARNAMRQLRGIAEVAATIAFDKVVQNLLNATSQAEDTAFVFENIYGDMSDAQAARAENFSDTYFSRKNCSKRTTNRTNTRKSKERNKVIY